MGYKSKFRGSTVEERLRAVLKKQDTLVSGVNIKTIVGESILGSGNLDILYKPITYQSLLDLREESKLKPGQFYRIIDYATTTAQPNTRSAGKLFDVIVLALTNDTLAERAWACHRDGGADFQNSHLEAWQLWYSLDNDTSRFEWAVPISEGGKGVIYRMIDEFGNDCPYDFKNIQFYREWDSSTSLWSGMGFSTDPKSKPCYTFSARGFESSTLDVDEDISLLSNKIVHSNIIKPWISNGKQSLNNNCFFIEGCYANIFGGNCYFNSVGKNCVANSFGDGCYLNQLGSSCNSNSFGNDCSNNSLGFYCQYNSFGSSCNFNSFGNYCYYNSFENGCSYIKFASDSSASTKYNYYQFNHFGDGCKFILFIPPEAGFAFVQNYNFAQGLQGTENEYLSVAGLKNRPFETKVAKNSKGGLEKYCEADLASLIPKE